MSGSEGPITITRAYHADDVNRLAGDYSARLPILSGESVKKVSEGADDLLSIQVDIALQPKIDPTSLPIALGSVAEIPPLDQAS